MFDIFIFEVIEVLLLLIALIIIFIASIKLFRKNDIPNSKLLLIGFLGSVVGVLLPLLETFYIIEESTLFNSLINVYLGIMFIVGAYGFWCLVNYSLNKSANKAIKKDV